MGSNPTRVWAARNTGSGALSRRKTGRPKKDLVASEAPGQVAEAFPCGGRESPILPKNSERIPEMAKTRFRKGTKVISVFSSLVGGPYFEATRGVVTKTDKDAAYFEDEWGITFDKSTGKERENFFPGMCKFLVREDELDTHPKAKEIRKALEE